MDPASNLTNTGNVPDTQNPQGTANPGASNADDFQSTAPSDALNQEAQNLSVESTGQPITDAPPPAQTQDSISALWMGIFLIAAVIVVYVAYRLIREEESTGTASTPAPVAKKAASAPAPKKTAATKPKKTTRSGKKKTTAKKQTKKSSKKR